jgi:lysophospholipase L1-like esterase
MVRDKKDAEEDPTASGSRSGREVRVPWKRVLFYSAIPLAWIVPLLALEATLVLVGYGDDAHLFDTFDPGLVTDNPEYVGRFYSLRDPVGGVQRSNLFLEPKQASRLRVFVVGGSTAQGFPFQRNHSFTAVTESALRSLGMDVEILNLGNSAMTSYYLREVLPALPRHEPDLVVIYAGHNEYYGTPSSFTGGTHALRLLLLRLKTFRSVQLLEDVIHRAIGGGGSGPDTTLMERRFAAALFPQDSARDRRVADRFVHNLDAGLRPLIEDGVPVLVFEPVSNLVSMPPFRSVADRPDAGSEAPGSEGEQGGALDLYRQLQADLRTGEWDLAGWERAKDMDGAPFRARSVLVHRLEDYVQDQPDLRWIPTSAELDRRVGFRAFGDEYFIDHVHFNFDGQILLGSILADAILDRFSPEDAALQTALARYFEDPRRIREDIFLTEVWEFMAYSRIYGVLEREPFLSMPLAKSRPALPTSIMADSLFRTGAFIDSLRDATLDDVFYLALDQYRTTGDRDGWIRNMNAYVHLFPGNYRTHLAYGLALLDDDPQRYIGPAASYFRRAFVLSGRGPEVPDLLRSEFSERGMAGAWEPFSSEYLN